MLVVLALAAVGAILFVRFTALPAVPTPAATFPGGPVVAFYGDSYTRGTGASDPGLRWSTLLSEQRGWNEVNPSIDGLGFVNNRLPNGDPLAGGKNLVDVIIDAEPDIVIVTMGLNDNFAFSRTDADIEEAIRTDLTRFDAELPDARIVVVEPFWYTEDRPESVGKIIGWVRDAAEDIGADYIAGSSHWLDGHPEWISADGLHPNDRGYAEFAKRMAAALDEAGL
ncbi:SGNH/GDSL hydrolase family protein [Planctomonas psychrotolerans]|uniref:SGNH/GDSL hydrolase family protein n=1 Tax=Planctomonas psychrotolerans TaxID=2528712 RepID=UPI001D0D3E57|nr:SGNH/GDSL hydrolase family protein [Planctomonas psychrotolerans]